MSAAVRHVLRDRGIDVRRRLCFGRGRKPQRQRWQANGTIVVALLAAGSRLNTEEGCWDE